MYLKPKLKFHGGQDLKVRFFSYENPKISFISLSRLNPYSQTNNTKQTSIMEIEDEGEVNPAEAIAAPHVRGGLNPETARLFRVYRTMANMLSERGYMVPKTMRELTPAQFKLKFGDYPDRESLTVLVEKVDDEKNQLFVFFPTDEKVGVKPIKTFTQRMQAEGVVNAIMVLRVDITAFAKQALLEMSDNFRIEHFKETELLVDITKHTVSIS